MYPYSYPSVNKVKSKKSSHIGVDVRRELKEKSTRPCLLQGRGGMPSQLLIRELTEAARVSETTQHSRTA